VTCPANVHEHASPGLGEGLEVVAELVDAEHMGKQKKPASPNPAKKPGPEADRLVIEGDWEEAVKKTMEKPNPRTPMKRKATP
jgi:hypothetical protein